MGYIAHVRKEYSIAKFDVDQYDSTNQWYERFG